MKGFLAVLVSLVIFCQPAHALDMAKAKFYVQKAIYLPVYLTIGSIAGPVGGFVVWQSVFKKKAEALAAAAAIKANAVKPTEQKEAVKDAAK